MESDVKNDDWISLTEASAILKRRYLKTRDLMLKGELGEIKNNETNRYFVRESAVRAFMEREG